MKALKQLSASLAIFSACLCAGALEYYWVNTSDIDRSGTKGEYWSSTADGLNPYSGTITFTDQDNIYYSDTAAMNMADMGLNLTVNKIVNQRAVTGGEFLVYSSQVGGTFNIGSILQDSAYSNMGIRNSSGTPSGTLTINVSGTVDVKQRALYFGTDQYQAKSLSVGGATVVESGAQLFAYLTDFATFADLTLNGTAVMTASIANALTVNGNLTLGGTSSLNFSNFNSSAATSLAVKGKLDVGTGAKITLGTANADYSVNAAGKIASVTAGDFDFTNAGTVSWNIGHFEVSAAVGGASSTGVFNWATNGGNRLYGNIESMNVDVFNMGTAGAGGASIFSINRGSDVANPHVGVGDLKFGTLTIAENTVARIGYIYTAAAGTTSFVKYDNVEIGTLVVNSKRFNSGVVEVLDICADHITIGEIQKNYSVAVSGDNTNGDIMLGKGGGSTGADYFGKGAKTITIGEDSNSSSLIKGGALRLNGELVTINGTMTFGAEDAGYAAALDVRIVLDENGNKLDTDFSAEKLVFDSRGTSTSANFGNSAAALNSARVEEISAFGGNTTTININAADASIGTLSVDGYYDGASEWKNSALTVNIFDTLSVDAVNVGSGYVVKQEGQEDTHYRTVLAIVGSTPGSDLNIGDLNIEKYSTTKLGLSTARLGDVVIDKMTVDGDGGDSTFEVYARDTSAQTDPDADSYYSVHIKEYEVVGSLIGRINSLQNIKIDQMTIANASSSAFEGTGQHYLIGTLDYEASGGSRFGGATSRLAGVSVGTLNMNTAANQTMSIHADSIKVESLAFLKQGALYLNGVADIGTIKSENGVAGRVNFVDNSTMSGALSVGGHASASTLTLHTDAGKSLVSTGTIEMKSAGVLILNHADVATANTYSFAGINGGDGTQNVRVTSNAGGGAVTINLTGTGSYEYSSRIHDFSGTATDPTVLNSVGTISINKTGSGVQKLRGQNYWRGTTTISDGELHIRTRITDNALDQGIGAVVLAGGALSAIEAASEIGTLTAESMQWDSGKLIVNINGASSDRIDLLGDLTKGSGTDWAVEFVFEGEGVILEREYTLITFDNTTFTDADLNEIMDSYKGGGSYLAAFRVDSDGLYVTISMIPEPAELAGFLGVLALAFAAWRKRRK